MFLYDIGVALYARIVAFVALWNKKAKQFTEGRKNIFERMAQAIPEQLLK